MDEHNFKNNTKLDKYFLKNKNWLQMVFIFFFKLFTYLKIYDNEKFHKFKT
jgi:hypothetical protein